MVNVGYCSNCGTKISNTDLICPNCGFKTGSNSKNSVYFHLDLKIVLFIFIIGVIAYQIINEIILMVVYLAFSINLNIFNFNSVQISYDFMDFLLEIGFIFFLYFLLLSYQKFSDKRELTHFLLEVAVFGGIGFGIGFLINDFITARIINSLQGIGLTYSILSLSDLIIYLPLIMLYNSLLITLTVLFVIFLQNKNILTNKSTYRNYFVIFIPFALVIGILSNLAKNEFLNYIFKYNSFANSIVLNSVLSVMIPNFLDLVLAFILAFICSKFLHESMNKQFLIYVIIFFIFVLVGTLIGYNLYAIIQQFSLNVLETNIVETFTNLLLLIIALNLSSSIILTIEFFAFLFLIQIYNSKIDSVEQILKENSENK